MLRSLREGEATRNERNAAMAANSVIYTAVAAQARRIRAARPS